MNRTGKTCIALVLLMATVALILLPGDGGIAADQLSTVKSEEGNKTVVSYVDADGKVAYASDKHYATVIQTYEDGHVVQEEYFDEKGRPARQTLGHYALSRGYEDGLATEITYLDQNHHPMINTNGYSSIHRTYDENGRSQTDTYYDLEGNQIQHKNGYYAYHRGRDEKGQITEITYLGLDGKPADQKAGYAKITRTYNDAGQKEYEFYNHADGTPAKESLGQYGMYLEYDEEGNTTVTTYLDADGKPMNIGPGYATVRREYQDGLKTVRYYDENGDPAKAGKGQYGVEYVDGKPIYLDSSGNRIFRLDNYLETHPIVVMGLVVIMTAAALWIQGKGRVIYLLFCLAVIVWMTLWYRESGDSRAAEPFQAYRQFFSSSSLRLQILNNIWLFIPLGVILYRLIPRPWVFVLPFLISVLVETIQYCTGLGLCEVDDVVSNSIGALIGYGIATVGFRRKSCQR